MGNPSEVDVAVVASRKKTGGIRAIHVRAEGLECLSCLIGSILYDLERDSRVARTDYSNNTGCMP